jgi:hypothetical protein
VGLPLLSPRLLLAWFLLEVATRRNAGQKKVMSLVRVLLASTPQSQALSAIAYIILGIPQTIGLSL